MANIVATFTSGLVLSAGAVYAFASFFTEQAHVVNYKLTRASLALKEATTNTKPILPSWKDTKPEVMNKYQQIAARMTNKAVPLAKAEWNNTIASAASRTTNLDRVMSVDRLASSILRKNES
ncbi:hypothetical protein GGI25_003163 [Coemansia spiralis]|uniref:Uncharacterized protein n=2 Tax=Coemansia TaxID=4863 RepID=A0A9W8G2G1_9FUNG|nr:hypothetical protein EDC05_003158 [Coemansia umbellata]KAJ2621853.1 hypothetical protein GGI26_003696 [Coemansia sp. RSA 1358]KAJ2677408.1 hypothetical protein GGI25_003163 [Coemansia spiralis]